MKIIKALEQAVNAAVKHIRAEQKFRALFLERYGADFSDIDCDPIIDACNGHASGYSTIEELDSIVLAYCGVKPVGKK